MTVTVTVVKSGTMLTAIHSEPKGLRLKRQSKTEEKQNPLHVSQKRENKYPTLLDIPKEEINCTWRSDKLLAPPNDLNRPNLDETILFTILVLMKPLQIPVTIRSPRADEVPGRDSTILSRIAQRNTANIVEGFTYKDNPTNELPFKFYCEINVDNSRLWIVFKSLLMLLPDELSFIVKLTDADPGYSDYMDKFEVLNGIEEFERELTQDGFLEFGVIYHDDQRLEEVYVTKSKYIQFWGTDEQSFMSAMARNDIGRKDDLQFIDEFPMVTEPLSNFDQTAKDTGFVVATLQKAI